MRTTVTLTKDDIIEAVLRHLGHKGYACNPQAIRFNHFGPSSDGPIHSPGGVTIECDVEPLEGRQIQASRTSSLASQMEGPWEPR